MYRNPAFMRGFFFGIHILIALIRNGFVSEDPRSAPPIGIRKLLCTNRSKNLEIFLDI
jgi:hypothetical protein